MLQLNRNLIFDMLLEIQALFKKTIKIQAKFDILVPEKSATPAGFSPANESFEDRFLKKALNTFKKAPEGPKRLHLAVIKHEEFERLIEQLIGYNDAIEGLLETGAIQELLNVQRQTYLGILQLNNKVDDLKSISLAMQVQTSSRPPTLVGSDDSSTTIREKDNREFSSLAIFKAQQTNTDDKPVPASALESLEASEIQLRGDLRFRCEATFRDQEVWVE